MKLRQLLLPTQSPAGGVGRAELWVAEGGCVGMLQLAASCVPGVFHCGLCVLCEGCGRGLLPSGFPVTEGGVSLGQCQQVTA